MEARAHKTPGAAVGRAAVDVGGTFTDLLVYREGRLSATKVPSTPAAPELGVVRSLEDSGANVGSLVHGSTVATNAVLERKGARTACIATGGFADVIEIGRQEREGLYDLRPRKPEPLVAHGMRFEAAERMGPGGTVLRRLTGAEAKRVAMAAKRAGADSVAVCLLFSFDDGAHERTIGAELERLGIHASLSCEVLPEYREYERASTTVINAYVSPVMDGYLSRLEAALGDTTLRLMHSAGGTISPETARKRAADLVLSGPAGGVVAASALAVSLGIEGVISLDMGGTSTDVALIDGEPRVTRSTRINGLPVALPMIDILTIGAGGGSIAELDRVGVLKVGPRSAGADPGPACYGRGVEPTVTDANLVLGRLDAKRFAGGLLQLDSSRAVKAMKTLGGRPVDAAKATLEVALSHMEAALKKVSLERGYDPREFTLVAFGGAGPMHGCELASRLEIPRVLVPLFPGLFSSMGMLLAAPGRDYTKTVMRPLDREGVATVRRAFADLKSLAVSDMAAEGFSKSSLRFRKTVFMRWRGQSHEVMVEAPDLSSATLEEHFRSAYATEFGAASFDGTAEVVNVRLSCRARPPEAPLPVEPRRRSGRPEPLGRKDLHFKGARAGDVFARESLSPGDTLAGPVLVLHDDTTTVIPPGWRATVDMTGNLDCEAT